MCEQYEDADECAFRIQSRVGVHKDGLTVSGQLPLGFEMLKGVSSPWLIGAVIARPNIIYLLQAGKTSLC